MFSATDFLPAYMIEFMNFEITRFPYFGSGLISRFSALWRRDIDQAPLFRPLGAVLGPALLTVLHALGIEHAARDVVAHAGQILDAAAADHDHRVLLQIVALTRNVTNDLEPIGKTHLCDLAERRIRLLRRGRIDAGTNAPLLRRLLQRGHGVAPFFRRPRLADQLVDGRHLTSILRSSTQNGRAPSRIRRGGRFRSQRTTLHKLRGRAPSSDSRSVSDSV